MSEGAEEGRRRLARIQADNYVNDLVRLDSGLLYFKRNHWRDADTVETDVFSDFWNLIFLPRQASTLAATRKGGSVPLVGPMAVWIPPFSVIQWRLSRGCLTWGAYLAETPFPPDVPRLPIAFPWDGRAMPKSEAEIFSAIREARGALAIGKEEKVSAVAARAKNEIDRTFSSSMSLAEIAHRLGFPRAVMTREFKACFGITPVAYRNKMRIFDSFRLLIVSGKASNISEIAHDVGFDDLSSFNKTFRKELNAVPTTFRLKTDGRP